MTLHSIAPSLPFTHYGGNPQTPDRIEPTDATASGFYIPNPNNALKNNAASGGWAGFNYPRLEKPVGVRRWRYCCLYHRLCLCLCFKTNPSMQSCSPQQLYD